MPDSKDPFDVSPIVPKETTETAAGAAYAEATPKPPKNQAAKDVQLRDTPKAAEPRGSVALSDFEARRRQRAADKADGTLSKDRSRRIMKAKPGDPAPLRLRDLAAADLAGKPTLAELEIIAPANQLPLESLTGCASWAEVLSKVLAWKALLGHIPAVQEIHDRLDPKVQRIEADVTARPMAPHGDNEAENAAAAAFFEELDD